MKRGKTDKTDAEAICEALSRTSMRFVPIKSEDIQALLMIRKLREFAVRQQTQTVDAMRHRARPVYIFESIEEVQQITTEWLWSFNNEGPSMGDGGMTPAQELGMAA